jgi:large subunit ribosomal protein L28
VARRCQLTGREPGFGRSVSHSHRRASRRWDPNIQHKRYWYPAGGRYVRLRLSTDAIRTIDRIGVDAAVRLIRARGGKV